MRLSLLLCALLAASPLAAQDGPRARARDLGVAPGVLEPGPLNAITDVAGVAVGQVTLIQGDSIRTGVTAILPHGGNLYQDRVPAAVFVGNGFGKLLGVTQVRELGELETPILLTCTLCVWKAADAMIGWMLQQPGMEEVRSLNAVVGETNDGGLNDIRNRPISAADVERALTSASTGPVEEGSVGAGTGTQAFAWKGGIGTSSRKLPERAGGWTVGVLVQSNFGGTFQVLGVPVGERMRRTPPRGQGDVPPGDGSIMIVVATDAPIDARNLERVAARAIMGLARTGSYASNGSGDYVIAFSTHPSLRRAPGRGPADPELLGNDQMSPLFAATVEATEEAIYNSLFMATTVTGHGGRTATAIPLDELRALLAEYGAARR